MSHKTKDTGCTLSQEELNQIKRFISTKETGNIKPSSFVKYISLPSI